MTTMRPERLVEKGLPTTLTLDLDVPPEMISDETIKTSWKKYKFFSHVYPEEVNRWFAAAIELEGVKVLRASHKKTNDLVTFTYYKKKEDQMKGFLRAACLHILNEVSCGNLDRKIRARYPQGLKNYAGQIHDMYRPNIVVDTGEAFSEDHIKEMRAGAALLRFTGPAIRCNQTRVNVDTESFIGENEPYSTLNTYRLVP